MATTRKRKTRASALKVLVTGATGFVGLHTARALHAAGHTLRLLVRDPDKMQRVLAPFGFEGVDHVVGDIADEVSVGRALAGCDAVVHAAAQVNVHAAHAAETIRINRRGTELVIGGAVERGIARIVQVSSTSALFNPELEAVEESTPLAAQAIGYGRSKMESDLYVRGLQDGGAPIWTTYPGTIMGPDDPGLSEGMQGLLIALQAACVLTSSGIQIVDVRDLAAVHLRLIERAGPPARYTIGGHFLAWSEFADTLEHVVGARLRRARVPASLLQASGRLADALHRFMPVELPFSYEASRYATAWTRTDDSRVQKDLGIRLRDIHETLADAVVWLGEAGHLRNAKFVENARRAGARRA
jgi:dihydroflavonol-4-reductase